MFSRKEVVLVTGSSGFLGQHVVKMLQERDDQVAEIRLFDLVPYKNKLGHPEQENLTEFVGDIRDVSNLQKAMDGVDCVLHLAAILDFKSDELQSVNTDGTVAVIEACLKKNVSRLVHASCLVAMCESKPMFYGTEGTTPVPGSLAVGKYAETKLEAEYLMQQVSGALCSDGKTALRTAILRVPVCYGEGDRRFILPFLKMAKGSRGCHYRVSSPNERCCFQASYVGNVAWAFLRAKDRLLAADWTSVSGLAFSVTDDTPEVSDVHELMRPYIEARGYRLSSYVVPSWLVWGVLRSANWIARLAKAVLAVDLDVPDPTLLRLLRMSASFDGSGAELGLDYRPIYTPEEAKRLSLAYYKNVEI